MIKEVKKLIKGRKLKSFSLGELLIALGIIGVLVMILMPVLSKAKPDENEILHKKTTFIVERVINELATDAFLYPKGNEYSGLSNTSSVTVDGVVHSGETKFCTLFAARLNKAPNSTVNCASGQKSVTSVEGIDWYLPVSDFKNADYEIIKVDVNGSKGPNCKVKSKTCYHPDQFEYKIRKGSKLPVVNIGDLGETAPPAARPIMPDEPAGNTTDPRTGQNWYCIRCNPTTNGSVYGYGCNKPNGHYQLVAIPKIGYKGSWFTKSVTVNNADVPASECNVTFTPIVDIPTPDGPTPPPTPTPTPDPTPEKTYCINVTKTGGDVTQCAVAGDGCNKKPGTYVVSASGKGDYKTSWSTKDVTIENKDVNLTVVCDTEPEDACFSVLFTGDIENCPAVMKEAPTCSTDKTKYTSGTYNYVVTPKAGYAFDKNTTASTKQVIINEDKTIPIDCTAAGEDQTKVRIKWRSANPEINTVSLKVNMISPVKEESYTINGGSTGEQTYGIASGNYNVSAGGTATITTSAGSPEKQYNISATVTPTTINIPTGKTGEIDIVVTKTGVIEQDKIDLTSSGMLTATGATVDGVPITASQSGNLVTVKGRADATISTFYVVPSNTSKPWRITSTDNQEFASWRISTLSGTGKQPFTATLSRNHFSTGCITASYTDGSATSTSLCFLYENPVTPVQKCSIAFKGTGNIGGAATSGTVSISGGSSNTITLNKGNSYYQRINDLPCKANYYITPGCGEAASGGCLYNLTVSPVSFLPLTGDQTVMVNFELKQEVPPDPVTVYLRPVFNADGFCGCALTDGDRSKSLVSLPDDASVNVEVNFDQGGSSINYTFDFSGSRVYFPQVTSGPTVRAARVINYNVSGSNKSAVTVKYGSQWNTDVEGW